MGMIHHESIFVWLHVNMQTSLYSCFALVSLEKKYVNKYINKERERVTEMHKNWLTSNT